MYTNNETGVIHPIHEIGKICKDRNILFCVDATQAVGKIDIDPKIDHIDFLVWSAHKMYGPKGVGALYFNTKKRIKIDPLLHGGGHEKKLRAGTLNVPAIVGFGIAAALSKDRMHQDADKILALRDYFEKSISKLPSVSINGVNSPRQYNISNVWFRYTENELLLSHLHHRLAVSTGSACSSASDDPSHVLTAMGLTPYQAKSCLRFSLGRYTTKEQIDQAIALVIERVEAVRQESPKWQMHEQGYDLADF
jgi:cysteine desulfurase